jgi:hypothetical protein
VLSYVVKAELRDPRAKTFSFPGMKTMYGGKRVAKGDEVFVFASETQGGPGLVARGVVTKTVAIAPPPRSGGGGPRSGGGGKSPRWTPRVSIAVERIALAKRALGREQLKAWRGKNDGSPQAELDFKFYRQATNKICGVSDAAAAFLRRHCASAPRRKTGVSVSAKERFSA